MTPALKEAGDQAVATVKRYVARQVDGASGPLLDLIAELEARVQRLEDRVP